ncbi:hypothetical protein SESBI_10695 [Sesbania bispinosa]|nr:hypothetical protein SESBI_10695 [Sesbania bispinosa]
MELDASHTGHESSVEGVEVQLEPEGEAGIRTARKKLIGRVLTSKMLNKGAVKDIISKAWSLVEELNISDLGPNVFLFNFSGEKDAKRVFDGGPWFVMGYFLSLQY